MIKTRDYKMIETLARIAVDVVPIRSARIAAAVVLGKETISYGTNQQKSHPFQSRFQKHAKACYWHAETNAIYNALKRVGIHELQNATLYVARVKMDEQREKGGKFIKGMAKPCIGCQSCIEWVGIKRVCYTTDETIEEM